MTVIHGKSACTGIAFGKIRYFLRNAFQVEKHAVSDPEAEVKRFEAARGQAVAELAMLYAKATKEVGEENSLLFQIHQMMLEDLDYCESVTGIIREEKANAEYAVNETAKRFAEMFSNMDDEYMRGRAADVQDVSRRVLGILTGTTAGGFQSDEPVIIAADDLAPSETVQLDKKKILAFVTAGGSESSHTAILARTMGIPAIIGVGEALNEGWDGREAAVDGSTGEVYLEPDEDTVSRLRLKEKKDQEYRELLEQYRGKETVTRSGQRVLLYANIGSVMEAQAALDNGAEGIGLFRTEFLFMDRPSMPDEEEQYEAYAAVSRIMQGREVIIRTLDVGGDKEVSYLKMGAEQNPFLGWRAIRYCLEETDLYKTQLRALLRAGAQYRNIKIMLPLVTGVQEVRAAKALLEECKQELKAANLAYDPDVQVGVMIETPAAALTADLLAKEAAFFSIGTNDLTQYTIAVDRGNAKVEKLYTALHPAVLRSIRNVIQAGRQAGIPVGMCGESAAEPELDCSLEGLRDEVLLSLEGRDGQRVLATRKTISEWSGEQAAQLTEQAMALATPDEVGAYLHGQVKA